MWIVRGGRFSRRFAHPAVYGDGEPAARMLRVAWYPVRFRALMICVLPH